MYTYKDVFELHISKNSEEQLFSGDYIVVYRLFYISRDYGAAWQSNCKCDSSIDSNLAHFYATTQPYWLSFVGLKRRYKID